MSLALAIALVVLITEFILWFGYSQIASLAYGVYLNAFERERIQKQRKTKRDILTIKHDLARTSSQDQFAKWAKLRRKLDSRMSELENITTSLGYLKTSFEIKFTTFLWVVTNGIQIVIVIWYRYSPVFYLPQDWFSPISWIFSMPFAPSELIIFVGSVSVPFWFLVCRKFVKKVIQTKRDAAPLYHKYAPESVKQHGQLLIQWCKTQIRIFTPIVVQWVNANVKTFCNIIAEKAKSSEKKKMPPPSTNGTSGSTSNEEENNDASKIEGKKEKKEKILEKN